MSLLRRWSGRLGLALRGDARRLPLRVLLGSGVALCATVQGQVATTTISDTVYHADGTPAGGLLLVSWPAFTTGAGQAVPGGSTSVTIGSNGQISVALAPNAGATPAGTAYTAVFHLDDGSVSRETWQVPVSSTPVSLAAVRSAVLPASVAVQTATKSYVDSAVAAALAGQPITGDVTFLNRTGDAMIGPLVLPGDPTTGNQAATKHYVDASLASVMSGIAGKLGMTPTATQAVVQPAGTLMQVNRLNSELYASQFVNGRGNNGLGTALASPDCAGGCNVTVEQTYGSNEWVPPAQWASTPTNGTHVRDLRGGGLHDYFFNPVNQSHPGLDAGTVIDVTSTKTPQMLLQSTGDGLPNSLGLDVEHHGLAGGSNLYPHTIEGAKVPYFKSNYVALSVDGVYNTQGQHVLAPKTIHCYGVGDCLAGAEFLTSAGGFRDEADEGTHPMDIQIMEDTQVFDGTCSTGCSTGSTTVGVAVTQGLGTQGDGRFLLDLNPSKVLTTGQLVGGTNTGADLVGPVAKFAGTSFPTSVFVRTGAAALSQAQDMAPGTVTLPIVTSGLPEIFSTSTSSLPASSGLACVTDMVNGFNPHNYEMAPYTTVDATHLQMTLKKVHAANATIAVGGLCGYGLEQTVDTANGIRQVFPVVGSASATSLYYAGGLTPIVGITGSSSAFVNVSLPVASMSRAGNVVSVTTGAPLPFDVNGLTMTVSGATDTSFNGSFAVTSSGPTGLTFANSGPNATTTGGTMAALTGGYALYPMAEVLSVYNPGTSSVDGTMTLAPNAVAWAAGDAVEEPHYFQEAVDGDTEFVTQQMPRPTTLARAGVQYQANVGPGLRGWAVVNAVSAANYLGNGGTHSVPDEALDIEGLWNYTLETAGPEKSLFRLHCNSHGCGKWNSGYNLFHMDSTTGYDYVNFQPQSDTMNVILHGATYSFTPGGLQAPSVSATTLQGALDASNVASGTLAAARLPLFGGSGTNHAAGAVPDPGTTAGATRFLREDGTWAVPSGGGTGGGSSSGTSGGSTGGTSQNATIQNATIQNSTISGGTIDGAAIGQQTPAAGTFATLGVTGCDFNLAGPNEGVGTCTPRNWNAVSGVNGSNLQIHASGPSRLIISSDGAGGGLAEFHFINMGAPAGQRNWRFSNSTSGQLTMDMNTDNYSSHTVAMQCQPGGSCNFPNGITASNFNGVLSGTTGTIGGAALSGGTCASGTASVPGATVGVPVVASAVDGSLPNGLTMLSAAVTSSGTVTVQVCAVATTTPAAEAYNVRVLQ